MNKITLIGSTGSTGRLIARQLVKLDVPFRLAGRNPVKLGEIAAQLGVCETLTVDVTRAGEVERAIAGSSVLINCAGPFTDIGLLVIKACAEAGVDYLDTTGEQDFVRRAVEDCSAIASKKGCALVPSCAFEYALGDAAAALLSEHLGGLDEFEATYVFDGISTSRGTRKSILRALGSPAYQLTDGELVKLKRGHVETFKIESAGDNSEGEGEIASRQTDGNLKDAGGKTKGSSEKTENAGGSALERDRKAKNIRSEGTVTLSRFPFPGGEVFLVPLHTHVRSIKTNLASPHPAPLLSIMSHIGPMIARSPLRGILDGLIDISGSDLTSPEKTTFRILCSGRFGRTSARLEISGNDPYGLTAAIAAEVAKVLHQGYSRSEVRVAQDEQPIALSSERLPPDKDRLARSKERVGTISASMVKGARFIKEITENQGVSWSEV